MIAYIGYLAEDGSIKDYRAVKTSNEIVLDEDEIYLPVKFLDLYNPSEVFIRGDLPFDKDGTPLQFKRPPYRKIKDESTFLKEEWLVGFYEELFIGATHLLLESPPLCYVDIERNYCGSLNTPTVPVHIMPILAQTPITLTDQSIVNSIVAKYIKLESLKNATDGYLISTTEDIDFGVSLDELLERYKEYE